MANVYVDVNNNLFKCFCKILDFMTMEEAKAKVDVDKHERGFRKIAWAFLKVLYLVWPIRKESLNLFKLLFLILISFIF